MNWLLWLAAGMSVIAFVVCGFDKRRAKKGGRRVPERTLFVLALLGGSFGLLLGMELFRHKTRKRRFMLGVPLIVLVQLGLAMWLWWHFGL